MKSKKPIRVGIVVPKYGLIGGGEKFAMELTERIAQLSSYEIHVFANQWKQQSHLIRFHKVPIISFPKYLTTVSFAYFAQQQIQKANIDLVHTHERIFSSDVASLHSIPHYLWVKNIRKKHLLSLFDWVTIQVERSMVLKNNNTVFLPVSSITRDEFLKEYPNISKRIEVLHPGVRLADFDQFNRNICRQKIR
jgi:UDP-glucose:(heptosyl)LPS alpha-1,3-glucosyltransferase